MIKSTSRKLPKISVIIPAYNCEKTIKYTIQSVLNQTFSDLELIIINDGSQDSTIEVIAEIQDSRIKVFSYPNAGGNVSRNRGLHLAVGEFVSFLDADDLWTPDKLHSQLKALQENITAKVAYSWTDYINANGEFILSGKRVNLNGNVYESLLLNNFLENGSNPLICRKALTKLGGFDESLSAAQDWDMWLRLAFQFDFVCVPSVQILYRISANSVSSNLVRQEKSCLQVLKRAYKQSSYLRDASARSTLKHNWNTSLANLYKYLTCKALQKPLNNKKGLAAAIFLWKYFLHDPLKLQNINFTLKLLLKIVIILIMPSLLDNITNQREVRRQEVETLLNGWVIEKRSENKNGYQSAVTVSS
ncbi:glycosyl transferase family protein [Nostoc commune NIES-4072]|uniref:Glycosyl transferase family protein n=1 Tax=Nostoc commune NIES-4072 TaxID=2005467 RepID=A0A2R5FU39_NOSCO|nr:glycosyltransferase [Nostoc commune]BBD67203.1 glycosyl transferase family protein [Nostoc commune HK-02]GBG21815.1 glycosyl transferase family protein [Nostoc commune NIES-4072]